MQLWKVSHSINFPYCFLKTSTDHIQRTLKTTGIRGSRSSPFMFTQTCLGQALDLAAEEFEPTAQSKASVISVQFSHSVMFDSLWPHERIMPGLPVHHQLPEFTQTHVHWVGDAIQPSHPLSSPSPLAPNPSQHQSLFQWVNSSHEVAKVLEFQLQHHSFQRTPRADLL